MSETAPLERLRDAERTRAEILRVATELFAEQGLAGARVDDIAERTRTTKRMIYYYFGGKEQLYLAVLESAYRGIREAEQSIQATDLPPREAVRRIAELTFDHHHAHPAFVRLVSFENLSHGEHLRRVEPAGRLGLQAASPLADALARGRSSGEFRGDVDEIDVHLLISSYCVFQVANAATFGLLFGRDLRAPQVRARHRTMLGDIVAAWLNEGDPMTRRTV